MLRTSSGGKMQNKMRNIPTYSEDEKVICPVHQLAMIPDETGLRRACPEMDCSIAALVVGVYKKPHLVELSRVVEIKSATNSHVMIGDGETYFRVDQLSLNEDGTATATFSKEEVDKWVM